MSAELSDIFDGRSCRKVVGSNAVRVISSSAAPVGPFRLPPPMVGGGSQLGFCCSLEFLVLRANTVGMKRLPNGRSVMRQAHVIATLSSTDEA